MICPAKLFLITLLSTTLFAPLPLHAADVDSPQCRELPRSDEPPSGAGLPYGQGLLWEVRKGEQINHLFGTIHVSDADIKQLPEPVARALEESDILILEAVPTMSDITEMWSRMMAAPGEELQSKLDPPVFARTVEILGQHQINKRSVDALKPWAAYLTMSYPPAEDPVVLDLHLMQRAKEDGKQVVGIEEPLAQLAHFENLSEADQVQFLVDTVCHYSELEEDFSIVKDLYREGKLGAIHEMFTRDIALIKDQRYDDLNRVLISKRNQSMYDAMQIYLEKGQTFIAIGALHLPGEEGILKMLEKDGYQIEKRH